MIAVGNEAEFPEVAPGDVETSATEPAECLTWETTGPKAFWPHTWSARRDKFVCAVLPTLLARLLGAAGGTPLSQIDESQIDKMIKFAKRVADKCVAEDGT